MLDEPEVERVGDTWSRVSGAFYRALNPSYRETALAGSRLAGRYSESHQRTLYLSSSTEGVDAAMAAHTQNRATALVLMAFTVQAANILDLRDPDAVAVAGVELADAMAPWQPIVRAGGEPASWRVRRRLESLGAHGLIDPSRTRPGLWHLTLFRWNGPGAPSVAVETA